MHEIIFLDSGPLGLISHPRRSAEINAWAFRHRLAGNRIIIPEISDYEVRRELLRVNSIKGLRSLDRLRLQFEFCEIRSPAMLKAAEFWAESRKEGRPTASNEALDADVILAGQAATIGTVNFKVATTNVKHLSRFVPADLWMNITP